MFRNRLPVGAANRRPLLVLSGCGTLPGVDGTVRYHSYDGPANVSLPPSTRTDRYGLGCPGE